MTLDVKTTWRTRTYKLYDLSTRLNLDSNWSKSFNWISVDYSSANWNTQIKPNWIQVIEAGFSNKWNKWNNLCLKVRSATANRNRKKPAIAKRSTAAVMTINLSLNRIQIRWFSSYYSLNSSAVIFRIVCKGLFGSGNGWINSFVRNEIPTTEWLPAIYHI